MALGDTNIKAGTATRGKVDPSTPEGLRQIAAKSGIALKEEDKPGVLGRGVQGGLDILLWSSRQVGVGLQKAKGVPDNQINPDLLPSDVLYGKAPEIRSFGGAMKYQFTTGDGLKRLATDIVLDPVTYLTLGTGAVVKIPLQTGAKVALTKTGKEMVSELANEMVEKGVSRQIAVANAKKQVGLLLEPGEKTLLERGGLANIIKALAKQGKKPTAVEVKKVLLEGAEGIKRKSAVRFGVGIGTKEARIKLFDLPKFSKLYEGVTNSIAFIPGAKALSSGLEATSKGVGKLFNRDFGLPDEFKPVKQKYIDSFDNSAGRIKRDIRTIFAGTSKDSRVAITKAIEKGDLTVLEPAMAKLAVRVKNIFGAIAREEERRGLLHKTIEDYVTHIYKNKAQAQTIVRALREGQPSAALRFDKTRVLPDLETAKALGLDPIEDIAEILNIRLLASERAKLTQDFVKKVGKRFGKEKPKEFTALLNEPLVKMGDVVTGVPTEFRNLHIPQAIADDIAKMNKAFFADENVKGMLRGYDKLNNFWKGSVTVLFPAFHFRNAISNVMQNFLDIGVNAFSPATHSTAVKIITGSDGFLTTELGEQIAYSTIRKEMKANQVFQDSLARTDVGRQLSEKAIARNTPFDIGRKIGRRIENEARVVNYITNLRRGLDFEDAAGHSKQFLFDYDNLSLFEKDVLRRAIPFYTWTRKNIALQVKALFTTPGKQTNIAKAIETINTIFGKDPTDEEKEFTPDWIAQGLSIMTDRKGDDRTFLVGFDLPLEDLFQRTTEFTTNPFRATLNLMAPYIKAPIEFATGKNLFRDIPIQEDDSGTFAQNLPEGVKKFLDYYEEDITTKEGKKFTKRTVDPERKWLWQQGTSILGVGRLSAATTVDGLAAMYSFLKEGKLDFQDKADIVRLFTAFNFKTTNLEAERKRQEKEEARKLTEQLERKGEVATFEKTYVPKSKR